MSRVQLSINVSDFDAAVALYSRLFGAAPAKLRTGYANFAIDDPPLKLVLNSPGNGPGGTVNHLGSRSARPSKSPRPEHGWTLRAWTPSPNRAPSAATRGRTRCEPTTPTAWPGSTTPSCSTSRRRDGATPPPTTAHRHSTGLVAGSVDWLRLARIARLLSWLTLAWMGIEGGVAIAAAVVAGSVALLGFGLDSGIEAMASVIVIWRFTGTRLASPASERRAQQLVAVSFFLLAPYIAFEAIHALAAGDRAETSIVGLVLTAGTAIFEPALGVAKRRIGARLGSSATAGEGTQNLLCAYLAIAVFAGLAANTLFGAWWLDGVVALGIAAWAVVEGRRAWSGRSCGCACAD
jgi:hypothetical protein